MLVILAKYQNSQPIISKICLMWISFWWYLFRSAAFFLNDKIDHVLNFFFWILLHGNMEVVHSGILAPSQHTGKCLWHVGEMSELFVNLKIFTNNLRVKHTFHGNGIESFGIFECVECMVPTKNTTLFTFYFSLFIHF